MVLVERIMPAAFNRTSMELKHVRECLNVNGLGPFNRTSMELKHLNNLAQLRRGIRLLIEPVWN